jgi:hypothetical protein
MAEIDTDMRDVDTLKQTKAFLKSQCDKLEEEVNNARRYERSIRMEKIDVLFNANSPL